MAMPKQYGVFSYAVATGGPFYLLYVIISFEFEVAILNVMYNMASLNIKLILNFNVWMDFPLVTLLSS